MLTVKEIKKTGYFNNFQVKVGDVITAFNGLAVEDILDYLYFDAFTNFTLTLIRNGEEITIPVSKGYDESMGLLFESDGLELTTCRNKCVFCFVDQMPNGMRPSLYVKDDDYRQSFLTGNFVTLTNVSDEQIERIIRLKLSPLYVSVQTMNGNLRKTMLGNRFADKITSQLKRLTEGGIKIEAQIVLVPNLNDGAELEYSVRSLYKLKPNLQSVAVVPCGITKFRNDLYKIDDITKGYADCVINQVNALNTEFQENFCIPADEFYFKAGKSIPEFRYYPTFSQVGNGVGLTAKFSKEIKNSLKKKNRAGKYLIISGESASEFIESQVEVVKRYCNNLTATVLAVKNEFFGDTVNCTGLLTGQDIEKAILNFKGDYDAVIMPCVCLRDGEDVFLDGLTAIQLKNEINKKIIITDGSGQSFFDALTGGSQIRIIK